MSDTKAKRKYLEAILGVTLSEIVAFNKAGALEALLPPITPGKCGWCQGHGFVRKKVVESSVNAICTECWSIALDYAAAIEDEDEQASVAMDNKLLSRKGAARGTTTKEYSLKELIQIVDAEPELLDVLYPKAIGTCFSCGAEGDGRRVRVRDWHLTEMLCNSCWTLRYATMRTAANSQQPEGRAN